MKKPCLNSNINNSSVLGSTKHNEGENDVFRDKSHPFWNLLMELVYKVNLKFKIDIINFWSILISMIASTASMTFIFKIPGGIHVGAIISTCNAIKW